MVGRHELVRYFLVDLLWLNSGDFEGIDVVKRKTNLAYIKGE
jgi:hypothetical protein